MDARWACVHNEVGIESIIISKHPSGIGYVRRNLLESDSVWPSNRWHQPSSRRASFFWNTMYKWLLMQVPEDACYQKVVNLSALPVKCNSAATLLRESCSSSAGGWDKDWIPAVDEVIKQWHSRLCASVCAAGHFKHLLALSLKKMKKDD